MADPATVNDLFTLQSQHSDIRREAAEHTNEIVKEALKGDYSTGFAIKDARHDIVESTGNQTDRLADRVSEGARQLTDRFFDVGRDTQDIRAQIIAAQQQMVAGFASVSKDTEIQALKTQIETAKQTTYLSDKIDADGEKTRALMTHMNNADLNRMLIERNTEIVDERGHGRHWRGAWDQSQFAALHSQFQAMNSQFAETRQGMVNFGTMAGVGQSSTSNNVR